jgi:ribosome maturation factor RimP
MDDRRLEVESGPARRVAGIIEPTLQSMGFRLVRVKFSGGILQVMAERPDGSMTVDDCAALSRAISPVLDVEDPIPSSYTLEVSSPGIDRPLVRLEDFERWTGHLARIELKAPLPSEAGFGSRRRFRGVIDGVSGEAIKLALPPDGNLGEATQVELGFDDIADAKLVLTDELLALAKERAKQGALSQGSDWQGDEQAVEPVDETDDGDNESDDERSNEDG